MWDLLVGIIIVIIIIAAPPARYPKHLQIVITTMVKVFRSNKSVLNYFLFLFTASPEMASAAPPPLLNTSSSNPAVKVRERERETL
jgi:hypothetical protein